MDIDRSPLIRNLYYNPASLRKNAVSAFQISCKLLSFTLEDSLKNQQTIISEDSIYHIKYMYIHHFTTTLDGPEIWCLMEVSTMFYICRYCVFFLAYFRSLIRISIFANLLHLYWFLQPPLNDTFCFHIRDVSFIQAKAASFNWHIFF